METELEEIKVSKWRTASGILLYSVAAGVLLAIFSMIPNMIRFVFSLLALYLVIRFFRKVESWKSRTVFIVLALFFYFLAAIVVAMVRFVNSGEIPAAP
ncbi:hypothetical protein [Paenibacillus protaetiae]|uniref:Uncharacterized protein n=1 Tax=Paenibacillus protaetiae TaxID=2509456 RepID=A0A4P6ERK6_9BACL|nr:hypothetical protein [Paenibacillus protaetiae]QAY65532.1 hypothetical protein ET464_03195 [Paenibacillus protaetiae]